MTTPPAPTIADVWSAFLRLSAAWDAKRNKPTTYALHLMIWADGVGEIKDVDDEFKTISFSTLADALTAIEAARRGLEG